MRYKAITVAVNGSNVGKTIISKYKGKLEKQQTILPSSQKIFLSAQSQYTQNNPISPNNGPTKFFFKQNLNILA